MTVSRVGELPDAGMSSLGDRRPSSPSPRTSPPAPEPREPAAQRESGATLPLVLMASIGAHVLFAMALAALPVASRLGAHETMIELEVSMPAPLPEPTVEPEPIAEPEPVAEPEVEVAPEPVRTPRPERVAAAPATEPPPAAAEPPPPSSAPPSLDDVFGEPPPPLPSMTAEGGAGAFAVAAGSADGAAGGVPGGRGRTIGATRGGTGEGTGGEGIAGPSADEVRRARRAYAERVRELLGRVARYPVPARRSGLEGRVVVALRIARDGRLLAARVATSCGYSMLDEAALAAANDLREVPAPPELCSWDNGDELRVPIVFELTD